MNGNVSTHGARLLYPDVVVFAAAAPPAAFTDLDLSPYVGARRCLVYLRVLKTVHTAAADIYFRMNGETADPSFWDSISRTQLGDATSFGHVLVQTSTAGIVEWYSTVNDNMGIILEAYLMP